MPYTPKSSVVIAKLLDSEGFSDHVANMVERYWRRSIEDHRQGRVDRTIRAFEEIVGSQLTDAQRLVLGKFIGLHKKMSFDTGLRIGLTAFQTKCKEEPADAHRR